MRNCLQTLPDLFVSGHPSLLVKDEELIKAVLVKDFQLFVERISLARGGRHCGPITEKHLIATNA